MKVQQLLNLDGKVALITGGSRGIGVQMGEALGEMDAKLALSARKPTELAEAKAHFDALGIACLTVPNDLSDFASIPGLVDAVLGQYGRIDILVNNAGCSLDAIEENYVAQTPAQRLGDDNDLKGLALLLASQASNYMTGQAIAVDGGFSAT